MNDLVLWLLFFYCSVGALLLVMAPEGHVGIVLTSGRVFYVRALHAAIAWPLVTLALIVSWLLADDVGAA